MRTILIVDDNKTLCDTLASYLCSRVPDLTVLTAGDGEKAIHLLESNCVNMILTDLVMPNLDGYTVIDYAQKQCSSVPVIIMTASWSLELQALLQKKGRVQYIEKPFRPEDIDRMVIEPMLKQNSA